MKNFWYELRTWIWVIIGLGIYFPLTAWFTILALIVTSIAIRNTAKLKYVWFKIQKTMYVDWYGNFFGQKILNLDLEDECENMYDNLYEIYFD